MSIRRPPSKPDLAQRLLTELVCRREETRGHPQDDPQAEAAARQAGGSLLERAHVRAGALADSPALLGRLRRLLGWLRGALIAWCLITLLAGVMAAQLLLGEGTVLNLPLALLVLVGTNLLLLALWLLLAAVGSSANPLAALPWTALAARLRLVDRSDADDPVRAALTLLGSAGRGRALAGLASHLGWLAYSVGALLTLALLMTLREFQFTWQTTLLAADSLRGLASALSWLPGLFGAQGPDLLPLQPPMSDAERQAWARWLLLAVAVYGAAPRLIAALVCAALARRRLNRIGADAHRPGIARLRARLLPDHRVQSTLDPAPEPEGPAATSVLAHADTTALPDRGVVAVSLEWPGGTAALGAPDWQWLDAIDDPAQLCELAGRLPLPGTRALVLALRASATPDRGLQRSIAALQAALPVPLWLTLGEVERLRARGEAATAQRLADWRTLAAQAGTQGLLGAGLPLAEAQP